MSLLTRKTKYRALLPSNRLRGQTIAMVGMLLALGVLIGLVALATDGGSALVQKRNMQNGADAAALAAAQALGNSVVISTGVPIYIITNENIAARVEQATRFNRGGSTGTPSYTTTLEYGRFVTSTYAYSTAASWYAGSWHYQTGYPRASLVPNNVDSVRITTEIANPTTFATTIGIDKIQIRANAAAALNDAGNQAASGPTWPMTRCATPDFDPQYGVCNPFLFWASNLNEPDCSTPGNFKNLMQLGQHQGASYEGAHEQLITGFDQRAAMTEVTGSNSPCGNSAWSTLWSPAGNCTDPINYPPPSYGSTCCANNDNVADVDIANDIVNEVQVRISLTSTWPSNYFRPGYTPPAGDWVEVYNGGNLGQNIAGYIRQVIDQRGVYDGLGATYGKSIDKVMYLYDMGEEWTNQYPGCSSCGVFQWWPVASNVPPQRVHISQSLHFRFYEAMANTGGFSTPASICGTSTSFNTSTSKVYGIFSGVVVDTPPCANPPCMVAHGLNNYVGFVDP